MEDADDRATGTVIGGSPLLQSKAVGSPTRRSCEPGTSLSSRLVFVVRFFFLHPLRICRLSPRSRLRNSPCFQSTLWLLS